MAKDIKELSLKEISKIHAQLKNINNKPYVSLIELAKELCIKKTDLLSFIETHPTHFVLKTVEKKPLLIVNSFEDDADNIVNRDKYIQKRQSLNAKVLQLEAMDNYGSIYGYYIQPSKDGNTLDSHHLNTVEKVNQIKDRFDLKPASYVIGGFGDSAVIKPENGFKIMEQHVSELTKEGWEIRPEPSKLDWKNS